MSYFEINKSPVDAYTVVHFGAGVAAHRYGINFWTTLAGGFIWDYAIEPVAKETYPSAFPHPSPDAPCHQFIDAIAPAVGWLIYDWFKKREVKQAALKGF